MFKKLCFRKPFESQHAKVSEILLKSGWQQFCHIFQSLWKRLTLKMSVLVISEILGLFVNILTADDSYSPRKKENLRQPIQMQLSKKQNLFLNFLLLFWNLEQVSKFLTKKLTVTAYIFPELQTRKDVIR